MQDDVLNTPGSCLVRIVNSILSYWCFFILFRFEPRRIVAVVDAVLDAFVDDPTQSTTSSGKSNRDNANLSRDQDGPRPLDSYRMSANGGDASGQYLMACNYHHGLNGVPQDYAIAVQWHHDAAQQGHALVHHNLAQLFQDGKGIEQNYALAMDWYREAADQDNASAKFSIGALFHHGKGVPPNYLLAMSWYLQAAHQGIALAQLNIDLMYENSQGFFQNYEGASRWY